MQTRPTVSDVNQEMRSPSPVVSVQGLNKQFRRADGSVVNAIDDVSFDVHEGDFIVLLGPSGCGKTTLLRSVAGLERPDSGTIRIHDRVTFSPEHGVEVPPEKRPVSMVFQSYALWPHMTAYKNVAYPLESQSRSERGSDIGARVRRVLEMVGIPELEQQYPNQLSGGQQQRVALARALVRGDGLILFDEPLSNVDAKVREQLRLELLSMQRELGFSALFVTHDQVEAMELAHRIAVLREGRIEQFGTPQEIYNTPASRYVANFIGSTNEFVGHVGSIDRDGVVVETRQGRVVGRPGSDALATGSDVAAFCRPEHCVASREEPNTANRWHGIVRAPLFVGSHTEYLVELDDGTHLRLWSPRGDLIAEGSPVWVSVDPADVHVLLHDGDEGRTDAQS